MTKEMPGMETPASSNKDEKELTGDTAFSRHSLKPKEKAEESTVYSGISEKGVELSREKAKEILKMLDEANDGAVMFLGGASEAIRTKSTAKVFGDEVKEILKQENRDDVIVLTEKDFYDIVKDENGKDKKDWKQEKAIDKIQEILDGNPDKKILIDFPLFLKGFNLNRWMEGKDLNAYAKELLKFSNNNHEGAIKKWFETEGKFNGTEGPNPTAVAEEHIKDIERLREFAKKYANGRELIISATGHSWNLDAVATYLVNNGEVTVEGFEKIGGKMISDSEIGKVKIGEDGEAVLDYKGREFKINEKV